MPRPTRVLDHRLSEIERVPAAPARPYSPQSLLQPVAIHTPTFARGAGAVTTGQSEELRCSHGHGDELPQGFALIADAAGPPRRTQMEVARGMARLSDRVIFGLLAVAVFSPVNVGQSVPVGYRLTFGANTTFLINDWWGRAAEFPAIAAQDPVPSITLDFSNWMSNS